MPRLADSTAIEDFLNRHAKIVEPTLFAEGDVIGEWQVVAFVGRGGSGEVYCVRHVHLGVSAAMKVLARDDSAARNRFVREARILVSHAHPAFPRFLGYGESEGRPYLVIELLEPLPLPNTDRAVARYLCKVCEGVCYLHGLGLVHRDIKPQNVLQRGDSGQPVLIDLGLVKDTSLPPVHGGVSLSIVDGRAVGVGTPKYAAPEQFAGGEVSPATDIHALGMLANECFAGCPPSAWRTVVRRSTSSIPAQRYASVAEFVRAVRRRHWLRRALKIAAGIVALAGVVAMVVWALKPELPRRIDLNGQMRVVADPVRLKDGRTYEIVGPGTFDADISGPTNVTLRLKNCVLLNRTKCPFPKNGIRYVLEDGVYLNFINMPQEPSGVKRRDFIAPYDGAFNDVRFGGPDTISGLRQLKNAEWYESLRDERK